MRKICTFDFFLFCFLFINAYVVQKNHPIFANETSKILVAEKLS